MLKAEREIKMKTKREIKRKIIIGLILIIVAVFIVAVFFTLGCKGNAPEIIGYTYDSGDTVWEMAQKCCPDKMDIRDVVREIEKINGIENAVVYDYMSYKVPIYQTKVR